MWTSLIFQPSAAPGVSNDSKVQNSNHTFTPWGFRQSLEETETTNCVAPYWGLTYIIWIGLSCWMIFKSFQAINGKAMLELNKKHTIIWQIFLCRQNCIVNYWLKTDCKSLIFKQSLFKQRKAILELNVKTTFTRFVHDFRNLLNFNRHLLFFTLRPQALSKLLKTEQIAESVTESVKNVNKSKSELQDNDQFSYSA